MSPASKSKSKLASRSVKAKASLEPSPAPASSGNGIPASTHNRVSGTPLSLETAPCATSPTPRNIDSLQRAEETDDHSGVSSSTTAEYDSVSNNGSCSGDSEDAKEKTPVPGSVTDQRDKIRKKNERKHQRKKERRARELHERCIGYLMSRKLGALAQQLVAMGISSEWATTALVRNEGRVEESVAWLFEGGEESKQQVVTSLDEVNLKIDIADELARIAEMEMRFKRTKQEVERAVVACRGDTEKAADTLKAQKQEAAPPRLLAQPANPPAEGDYDSNNKPASSNQNLMIGHQMKETVSVHQQLKDERDCNYARATVTGLVSHEISADRNLQSLESLMVPHSKLDWAKPQFASPLEKRWPIVANSTPTVSYSPSPLHLAVQQNAEARFTMVGNVFRTNLQAEMLREPVMTMQRPPSFSGGRSLPSETVGGFTGWDSNGISSIDVTKAVNELHNSHGLGLNASNPPFIPPNQFQSFVSNAAEFRGSSSLSLSLARPSSLGLFTNGYSGRTVGSSLPTDCSARPSSLGLFTNGYSGRTVGSSLPTDCSARPSSLGLFTNGCSWRTVGSSLPIDCSARPSGLFTNGCSGRTVGSSLPIDCSARPSSLGLFTNGCSGRTVGSSLPIDCSAGGSMPHSDYTCIDWSLESSQLKKDCPSDVCSTFTGIRAVRPVINGGCNIMINPSTSVGSIEWTSPFAGKDLFRGPRQLVTSPSL